MTKLLTAAGVVLGTAAWFLLFVILGIPPGTAFIAGGCVLGAGMIAAGMASAGPARRILDAPLTSVGALLGIAAFVILQVVLSVPMWVSVVAGLGVMGAYGLASAAVDPVLVKRTDGTSGQEASRQGESPWLHNGHDRPTREPVGAR